WPRRGMVADDYGVNLPSAGGSRSRAARGGSRRDGTLRARFVRMRPFFLSLLLAAAVLAPAPPVTPAPEGERDFRRMYLRARSAVADGQYREALDLYRKVIERMPDDA